MLESIYRYAITNQKGKDVPYPCRKFYSLGTCTLEAGIHYLELVQSALHRHNYTYLSEFNRDVVQIISCLYPGHLKTNFIKQLRRMILIGLNLKSWLTLLYHH